LRLVCIDTSAWVALVFPRDRSHASATSFHRSLQRCNVTKVTTDYVLDETLTLLRRRGLSDKQMHVFREGIEAAQRGGSLRLVMMSESVFSRTWDIFDKYEKLGVSFTDCHLALVTREVEADGVFTYDRHFTVLGLQVFPESQG
jgi:predicted nucleic acid-binding protein